MSTVADFHVRYPHFRSRPHSALPQQAAGLGRLAILRRGDDTLVGLVARRDLLRVRTSSVRQERERERLIRLSARRAAG